MYAKIYILHMFDNILFMDLSGINVPLFYPGAELGLFVRGDQK
jgi:hypothetical protein